MQREALREGYKEERTACINRIRGLLAEFGLVFTQGPEALRLALPDVLEDASNELPWLARVALQRAQLQWVELECHIAWCDERIAAHVKTDEQARTAAQLCGIGPVSASALVASVGDFAQFDNGGQFGARLGLVPSLGLRSHLTGTPVRKSAFAWATRLMRRPRRRRMLAGRRPAACGPFNPRTLRW